MIYSLSAFFLLAITASPCFHYTDGFSLPSLFGVQRHASLATSKTFAASTTRLKNAASSDDDECSLEEAGANDCLSMVGYTPSTKSFVTVTEVFVAQVETLKDRFESYEDDTTPGNHKNRIRFNKRRAKGQHIMANSTILTNSPNGEDNDDEDDEKYDPAVEMTQQQQQEGQRQGRGGGNVESHTYSVANLEYNELIDEDEVVLIDTVRRPGMKSVSRAFPRAGPRKKLHFNPSKVNAAIVTCGGLCPGLNNVIRELVHSLYYIYGANNVYGITGGFHGFHKPEYPPILLTNDLVENIHHDGGTVLRSSRGGFDMDKILAFLEKHDIQQLYIIGGDGTHRGAYAIHQACMERNLNVAVAGIPKTIDNDVDFIDRSFGFQSAVEAAQAAIKSAKTEAMCNVPNGIGICKLMGRSAGFLAAFAALGSGDVDLVLVPEVPIVLEGPNGILPFLRKRTKEQKYAVVVVAEGAGEELLGVSEVLDAGGNRALPEIGPYLQKATKEYFSKFDEECTIKYIDPSYTVRSVPANGADALYCQQLAMDAVHGCMAGYTGFSVGLVNKSPVYIPIPQLVASSPRNMDPRGTAWERILAMTGQPNTAPPRKEKLVELETIEDPEKASVEGDETVFMECGIPEPTAH